MGKEKPNSDPKSLETKAKVTLAEDVQNSQKLNKLSQNASKPTTSEETLQSKYFQENPEKDDGQNSQSLITSENMVLTWSFKLVIPES